MLKNMTTNTRSNRPLFNEPQWLWYVTQEDLKYPCVNNQVEVTSKKAGKHILTLAVPSELYMVLKHKNIKKVYGFTLNSKLFSMNTDQGVVALWHYITKPKWANIK